MIGEYEAMTEEMLAEVQAAYKAARETIPGYESGDMNAMMVYMDRRREVDSAVQREWKHRHRLNTINGDAVLCWRRNDLRFYLCESPVYREIKNREELRHLTPTLFDFGRYNGYVHFPKLPGVSNGYGGIYNYVQVHGGITYFEELWDESVIYGFDTAHAISTEMTEIINDIGWMMMETESMARNIQIAARFEPYYLRAGDSNEKKARVLDRMSSFMQIDPTGNFGTMLNLLSGEL